MEAFFVLIKNTYYFAKSRNRGFNFILLNAKNAKTRRVNAFGVWAVLNN